MSLARNVAVLLTLTAGTALAQLPPVAPPVWWTELAPVPPQPAPEAQEQIDLAFTWFHRDAIPEAFDAMISALSHDPTAHIPWRALRRLRVEQTWRTMPLPILREYPGLDAILTCGDPELWPRYAVMPCAQSYTRFAQDLDERRRHLDASRYRRILAHVLIRHGADAFGDSAHGCVLSFLSLSNAIEPFTSRERDFQVSIYRLWAVAAHHVGNDLVALDALAQLANLDSIKHEDRLLMSLIANDALRDVSWESSTGLLRVVDATDFFDSRAARTEREEQGRLPSPAEQGTPMPYGMTSFDEDYATIGEIRFCDCPNFDLVMDARLASRNFELPVKAALYLAELVSQDDSSDGRYKPEMATQLPQLIERIAILLGSGDGVPDQTLVGFETARRISSILTRAGVPP
jgi:hypothetical protein